LGKVKEFLDMYKSKSTVIAYRWALTEFFKSVYGENENHLDEYAERYFKEKRNYESDIQNFLSAISERPPKSIRMMIAVVRSFLIENDVELPKKYWKRLSRRIRGNRARTIDKVPSNLELKHIIMHMPIQGKALYLTLASSGMRIGETLKLKVDDVDLGTDPAKITIRGTLTKTGNPRVTFISSEAKEMIQEWLNYRDRYLQVAKKRSYIHKKSEDDMRLFPFEISTAYKMWSIALSKAGLHKKDEDTNRHRVHPHVLRKFFRTKMGSVIPVDVVEALMGHEGYLTEVYRRYSMEDLAKFYKQGEPSLLLFTQAEEIGKLRAEIEERNKQLQTLVNGLTTENLRLKNQVETLRSEYIAMKREHDAMKRRLDHFMKVADLTPEKFKAISEIVGRWMEKERLREEQEAYEREMKENEEILAKLRKEGKL